MIIAFNEWSRERIKQGRKICTSRHNRYPEDSRVFYISPQLPWWLIRTYFWEDEGADSPEELQEVIERIMHRNVLDDELFYVHFGDFEERE